MMRGVALVLAAVVTACTTLRGAPDRGGVAERLESRTGQRLRPAPGEPEVPPGVRLDDDITSEEAVAVALWNNAAFQADLAELGFARADVLQAGLLRNPVLTLLLPWGPKQLEATAKWPIDTLWLRPARLRAARASSDALVERLTARGLGLVTETKIALVDLAAARERVEHASADAALARRIAEIGARRFVAGDISQLEVDVAEADAQRAEQDAARAELEATLAANRLHHVLGLGSAAAPDTLQPETIAVGEEDPCGELTAIERDALAARPDLRAAELSIEAAATRLRWERKRVVSIVGILDANAEGEEGFEMGPGLEIDTGLIDRNRPGTARASAELERAKALYGVTRQQILRETRDAFAELAHARAAAAEWRDQLVPSLAMQAARTERAYDAGEVSYLTVLEVQRRLAAGRSRELDARADAARAMARLEQSVGMACRPTAR
jgi:cobalt-zinc-cadmium efflux system outer membrane protein